MATADEQIRAAILRYLEYSGNDPEVSHEIYAEDAVLEFPQSGERFVGKRNFVEWRRIYPADVEFAVRRIRGGGSLWIAELSVRYDGGVAVRGEHPRVPRQAGGARDDLRRAGVGCARMAGSVASRGARRGRRGARRGRRGARRGRGWLALAVDLYLPHHHRSVP
jgi:hypothetical protein